MFLYIFDIYAKFPDPNTPLKVVQRKYKKLYSCVKFWVGWFFAPALIIKLENEIPATVVKSVSTADVSSNNSSTTNPDEAAD